MRNLIVYYESGALQTKLEDVPVPTPAADEVLIKVEVAGSNTKDWKHPLPTLYNNAVNQGDDCAGTVAAVGDRVKNFRIGERVAGFHRMDELHGAYADFCICPETTVFRIPDNMAYEEAATIPLAAYTAAVALWRDLGLPAPWDRSDHNAPTTETIPLVINGASTAVGSFAVKLAKMSPRIGPIITIAGASAAYVKTLGPDAVLDYRSSSIVEDLKSALGGAKVRHVFDTSNTLASIRYLTAIMEPQQGRYVCTSKLYANETLDVDDAMEKALQAVGAWYETAFVGDVHAQPFRMGQITYDVKPGGLLFGAMLSRAFEMWLADGSLHGHQYRVVEQGLNGVLGALEEMKGDKRRGNAKYVTRISEPTAR